MIEHVSFEQIGNCLYFSTNATNIGISNLGNFLTDDVGWSNIDFFKKWLNDASRTESGGNYSHVEKLGDKIRIWFQYDYFEETPGAEYFETSVEELNTILYLWKEVIEKRPAKVIITRDNGKITFTYSE